MKCPHHNLPEWKEVKIFHQDLNQSTRQLINLAVGGSFGSKTLEVAKQLTEKIAMNNYQWNLEAGQLESPLG